MGTKWTYEKLREEFDYCVDAFRVISDPLETLVNPELFSYDPFILRAAYRTLDSLAHNAILTKGDTKRRSEFLDDIGELAEKIEDYASRTGIDLSYAGRKSLE
ncbi:hypothetical protein BVX95_02040 [archaeon D22]|nr:hypothetical protein BVX95_02040 [archaeon D22]